MKIVKEFSRFAHEYTKHNVIQKEVAQRLVSMLENNQYKNILDLGSGSGAVFNNIKEQKIRFKKFTAFDFSSEMLGLHPRESKVNHVCADFNSTSSFSNYIDNEFSVLISASALQWSDDLAKVLHSISRLSQEHYFAFFTSNTFATLHHTAKIKSPIYSQTFIIEKLKEEFIIETDICSYQLEFESVRAMFRYIKQSGVSGGRTSQLSYKEMKALMKNYPLSYLEFEVLFVRANKLKN